MPIVPIFPLGAVLYPTTRLPIHVFEPRYRAMIRDCLAEGIPFGVIAVRQGSDTDPGCLWYEVGTIATIERVVRLPRGRSNLVVRGDRRFRVLQQVGGSSYPRAEIEMQEDQGAVGSGLFAAARLREAYDRYRTSLLGMGVTIPSLSALPRDPEALAWTVAGHLVIELRAKQRLLEEVNLRARVHTEVGLLRREATLLHLQMANRLVQEPTYSLN